jgi:hypothetical protein
VALLAPLPNGGPLEQLRSSGQLDEASGDFDELPEPIVSPADIETPSTVLTRLRRGRTLMRATYLDSSAVVKLVIAEPESAVVRHAGANGAETPSQSSAGFRSRLVSKFHRGRERQGHVYPAVAGPWWRSRPA